jgi:hypothetical protein
MAEPTVPRRNECRPGADPDVKPVPRQKRVLSRGSTAGSATRVERLIALPPVW